MNLSRRIKAIAYQECRRKGYGRIRSAVNAVFRPFTTLENLYEDSEFFWNGMPDSRANTNKAGENRE